MLYIYVLQGQLEMAKNSTITYSCRVLPEVAQLMKKISVERGLSQAKVLAMALRCLTESNADHTQESTGNEISELLKEELRFKNNEINRLLETINQQNHLLAAASKKELLLIEEKPKKKKKGKKIKDAVAENIPTTTSSSKKKKGKRGKPSKTKKNKK